MTINSAPLCHMQSPWVDSRHVLIKSRKFTQLARCPGQNQESGQKACQTYNVHHQNR